MTDHHYKHAPVCPHCDGVMSDAFELDIDEGGSTEVWCGHCGASYFVTKHVTIRFSSRATERGERSAHPFIPLQVTRLFEKYPVEPLSPMLEENSMKDLPPGVTVVVVEEKKENK